MALEFSEEVTSGVAVTEVPAEVAQDLKDAYAHLAKLPANRQLVCNFDTAKEANLFVRQGKAWALANGLVFSRRGAVSTEKGGNPLRVAFRIYVKRADATTEDDGDSEE